MRETTNLFLLEDLDDVSRTRELAEGDLDALHAVARWIETFVVEPHKELGRAGPVCPFVPGALERKTLWLAPEQVADRRMPHVVEIIKGYQERFLGIQPTDGDDAVFKSFVIVFTDLRADRSRVFFEEIFQRLAVPSYVDHGFVMGAFYQGNEGTAVYNPTFRPFISPAPFLLMRQAVISDWKFFLDNEDWLKLWAHRYGESAVQALAEEVRRLPWRAGRDSWSPVASTISTD